MQLTMIKTTPGSRDGAFVETFAAGKAYTFTTEHELGLARTFVDLGVAEEAKEKPAEKPGPDTNKSTTPPNTQGQGKGNGQPPAGGQGEQK